MSRAFWKGWCQGTVLVWKVAGPVGIIFAVYAIEGWAMYATLMILIAGTWLAYNMPQEGA